MSLPTQVQMVEIDAGQAGQRIDNFLLTRLKGVPKSRVYRILRKGEVRVNKKRVKPVYRLQLGDEVRIPPVRMAAANEGKLILPEYIKQALQTVIYKDEALLVVNKPAGLAAHVGSGLAFGAIEALRSMHPDWSFLELTHRLDRETSGVLILAKQRAALVALQSQLRREADGVVAKSYLALLSGPRMLQPETVTLALDQQRNGQGKKQSVPSAEGQAAKSVFLPIEPVGPYTLVRIQLHTGRMHQARAHALAIGRPIVGDPLYGDWAVNKAAKQWQIHRTQLHSEAYAFAHPISGEQLKLKAPLAQDMRDSIALLKASSE